MYVIFYRSAMILSLLLSLYFAAVTWRFRNSRGARALLALAAGTFVWTLGFFLESNSTTLEGQLFFNNLGYLGSMSVPVTWFIFAVQYTRRKLHTWKQISPLYVVPVAIVVLVWSNGWHHLMWSNEHLVTSGSFLVTNKTYGVMFWVAFSFNYLMVLAGTFLLLRRLFVGAPLFSGQAVSLLIAAALPVVWNIIYVFNLTNLPRKDLTPAMFAASGLAVVVGVMRFRLLTVVPFARRFVIEQLNDGVFAFDNHGRLLEANAAALRIAGLNKDVIGRDLEEIFSLSSVFACLSPFKQGRVELALVVSGENRFYEMETILLDSDRKGQKGWLAVLRDITERKQMQLQLIMQDRLASIGQLVSGVAHELNNPLTSVIGFSSLLLQKNLPGDIASDLKIINDEAQRTADIVSSLLVFARGQGQKKEMVDINVSVQSVLKLRANAQRLSNIVATTSFAADLPQIMGNSSQLQQVFFNIVINAEQSMFEAHKRGILTVATARCGDFVRISFTDDGSGITKENMARLFTPFFTTKEVGKGTGLGLSICHGIAAEHGGKIWAESEPGKGAAFIVELPVPAVASV